METCCSTSEGESASSSLSALTARLDGVLSELADLDLTAATDAELVAAVPALVGASRRLASVEAIVLDRVDRTGAYRPDGHVSARVMVRHAGSLSGAEAHRRWKRVRMLRDLPQVAAAYRAGTIGTCQVDELARTHANPRVRPFMAGAEALFLADASSSSFAEFRALQSAWRGYVDQDGAADRARQAHDGRDVRLHQDFDGGWHLEGRFGSTQGSIIAEIFDRFVQAETAADWDKARAEHGDATTEADLARTTPQRRADAFWALCRRSVTQPAHATASEPLVNILVDLPTLEDLATGTRPDPTADPVGYRTRRASTIGGNPIDPAGAFAAALVGQLRRVVIDSQGVVIDLGRRSRFFTGSARDAATLARTLCVWPGCETRSTRCEIDHAIEWQHGGTSNQANGPPLCKYHNLFKHNHDHTITLEPDGRFHTRRPDGTELT